MRTLPTHTCTLPLAAVVFLVTATGSIAAAEPLLILNVRGGPVPAKGQVAQFDLDAEELGTPALLLGTLEVWEVGLAQVGPSPRRASFAAVSNGAGSPTRGTLFWLMDGETAPGATRRFEVRANAEGTAIQPRDAPIQPVTVGEQDGLLRVSNGLYEVVHDPKQGGTIVEAVFLVSGKHVAVRMADSMGWDRDYALTRDDEADIVVRGGDNPESLGVVVEARTTFRAGIAREKCPRVVYRYTYTAGSPLVRVDTVIPAQEATQRFTHVRQFVFEFPEQTPFTRADRIVTSGTGTLMATTLKWSACEARPPAGTLLANDTDAFGLITPVTGTYRLDAEAMHVKSRGFLDAWQGEEITAGATLYLGPADKAGAYLPLADVPAPRATIPSLGGRITRLRQRTDLGPLAAVLARAAELRMQQIRRLDEAEELLTEAERSASKSGLQVAWTTSFVAVANRHTGLLFRTHSGTVALDGLFRRSHAFQALRVGGRPFWRARLQDTETKQWLEADPTHAQRVDVTVDREADAAFLTFRWPGIHVGPGTVDAEARVRLGVGDTPAKWSLTVRPTDQRLSVWEVRFPIVGGLTRDRWRSETDFLVFPYKTGSRIPNPACAGIWKLLYPGAAGWQFFAYWQGTDGLYVAAHDPDAAVKTVRSLATGDGTLELSLTHPVPGMGTPGAVFESTDECVVGSYEGDWYDAARIYREWLVRQSWFPRQPLHATEDVPPWLKDVVVSTRRSGDPRQALRMSIELHEDTCYKEYHLGVLDEYEVLGSPPMLFWSYHAWFPRPGMQRKFALSPCFPAPPGFAASVEQVKQHNIRLISYSLAGWWDYEAKDWEDENAVTAAIVQEDGKPFLYERRGVGIMCAATKLYQDKMRRVALGLLDQAAVDGTYFDLGGTSGALFCHSPEHGHPVGSGAFASAGKRELMRTMRQAGRTRNPEFILVMEGNADCYLDTVDGYALFEENVPVRQVLYADYRRTAGGKRVTLERSALDAICPAKHLAWGGLIGRFVSSEMLRSGKTVPEVVAYYRNLVDHKRAAQPWLNLGRLLRPPRLRDVSPPEPPEFVTGTLVPSGTWRAPDGSVAFVFANARRSTEVAFRHTISPSEYGVPADGSWALFHLTPDGDPPTARFDRISTIEGSIERTEKLGPGGVLILVAKPEG